MKILISEDTKFQAARYGRMAARWYSDTLIVKLPVLTRCCSCREVGSIQKQICCEENFQASTTPLTHWRQNLQLGEPPHKLTIPSCVYRFDLLEKCLRYCEITYGVRYFQLGLNVRCILDVTGKLIS